MSKKISNRDITKQFFLKAKGITKNKLLNERASHLRENYSEDLESSSDIMTLASNQNNKEVIAINCLVKNLVDERSTLYDIIQICMDKNHMSQDEATEAIMVTLRKALESYKISIS